jgi:hypothetical protein
MFLDVKRSMLRTTTRIPPWLIVALLVLGWNQLRTLLSSPFYLLILLTLSIAAYMIYALNLCGPLVHLGKVIAHEFIKGFQNKMSGIFATQTSSSSMNFQFKEHAKHQ